jgi:hypothetical protein
MATVLTTGSQLACSHGGSVTLSGGRAALTVNGKPVLARLDVVGRTVSGCPTPATSSSKPCTTVASLLAGESTRLTAGGQAVLTTDARGLTDGVTAGAFGQWSVRSAGHSTLEAS